MSSSTAVSPEEELHEHAETNGLRERGNHISRRDYNNAIGGPASDADGTNTVASKKNRRREIRRRLRERHNHVAPKVRWTKFMHSETKNRMVPRSNVDSLADQETDMVAILGEFIGTTMFLFFAFAGTQVANIGAGQTMDNSTTGATTGFKCVLIWPPLLVNISKLIRLAVLRLCYTFRFVLASA